MVHRGATSVDKGCTIPRAPNHCGGRQMTAEGAEKSKQCHKCFLEYSTFASDRSQVRPEFLKVGGIAPLGAILMSKGAIKTKRAIGGETTKRGRKRSITIDHWGNFSSLLLWFVSFLQSLMYYDNRWRLLLKQFVCWIFTLQFRSGVTNVVPAGARSASRTMEVARGPVLKITLAWSISSH